MQNQYEYNSFVTLSFVPSFKLCVSKNGIWFGSDQVKLN